MPLRPLSLINVTFFSDHNTRSMLSIFKKLSFVKAFFRNELQTLARLVTLFTLFFTFTKIESSLIIPDDFLVGFRDGENETVLKLFYHDSLQGLSLDWGYVEFSCDSKGQVDDLVLVAFGVGSLGTIRYLRERKFIIGNFLRNEFVL